MYNSGYTEINKSSRIDTILRISKDSIEGYQSKHNNNFLLTRNNANNKNVLNTSASFDDGSNLNNKLVQRIIYSKNKSKSKIVNGYADFDMNDDKNDDDCDNYDDDDNENISMSKIKFNRHNNNNNSNKNKSFINKNESPIKRTNSLQRDLNSHSKMNEKPQTVRTVESSNLKRIQRNQIYALNELMTQLEYEDFLLFCKENNIQLK